MMATGAVAAYAWCEGVTRQRARNFYYGIRLLPGPKRRAMCAVYALARQVDDIGDGSLPEAEKLAGLALVRSHLARLDQQREPVYFALADAARRYPIPLGAFGELIDGVEMDVRGARFPAWEDLHGYCRRVAGSIGRLSVGVFGAHDRERADQHADTLGVAMQVTNILRDVGEDAANGRVYLPTEDLRRFGCATGFPQPGPNFGALVTHYAGRARQMFNEGLRLLPLLDRRSAACVTVMTGIYRRLLDRIADTPTTVLSKRISLSTVEKLVIAVRGLVAP